MEDSSGDAEPCHPLALRFFRLAMIPVMSELMPARLRTTALRALGARIGDQSLMAARVLVTLPRRLEVGARSFVNLGVLLESSGGITIEDDAQIGTGTKVFTTTHDVGPSSRRVGVRRYRPVHIGAGAWVSSNVTILPGVRIGSGAIIAAGAVVTRDVGPDGLYAGIPARRVRDLESGGS